LVVTFVAVVGDDGAGLDIDPPSDDRIADEVEMRRLAAGVDVARLDLARWADDDLAFQPDAAAQVRIGRDETIRADDAGRLQDSTVFDDGRLMDRHLFAHSVADPERLQRFADDGVGTDRRVPWRQAGNGGQGVADEVADADHVGNGLYGITLGTHRGTFLQ